MDKCADDGTQNEFFPGCESLNKKLAQILTPKPGRFKLDPTFKQRSRIRKPRKRVARNSLSLTGTFARRASMRPRARRSSARRLGRPANTRGPDGGDGPPGSDDPLHRKMASPDAGRSQEKDRLQMLDERTCGQIVDLIPIHREEVEEALRGVAVDEPLGGD